MLKDNSKTLLELGVLRDSKLYLRITKNDDFDESDAFMQSIAMLDEIDQSQGARVARDGGFSGSILQKQRRVEGTQEFNVKMGSTPEQQNSGSITDIIDIPLSPVIPVIVASREFTEISRISSSNSVTKLETNHKKDPQALQELGARIGIIDNLYSAGNLTTIENSTCSSDDKSPTAFQSLIDMGYDKRSVRGVIGRHPHMSVNELALRLLDQQSQDKSRAITRKNSNK